MEKNNKIKILVLDDEKQITEELCSLLKGSKYDPFSANTVDEAMKMMSRTDFDLLFLDVRLRGANGLDVLKKVQVQYPTVEVVMISGHGDMDTVIESLRNGALDYLKKPVRYEEIELSIERSKKIIELRSRIKLMEEKNSLISKSLQEKIDRQFIGVSPQILSVYEKAMSAAEYPESNVLITGESGTGKENIARIIHYSGARKDHIMCTVNSSAITDTLLESEFFGHKKGSFTGAISDKIGFFEVCNNGTLFLDEIADMPLKLQSKILRAIEEKVITRVGDTKPVYTNFRIISATNHDIQKRVDNKEFRLDLFHRLNTLHIHMPALRERPQDIKPLLQHFVQVFSVKFNKQNIKIDKGVFETLIKYDFPGNIRELKNMTERAMILCKATTLTSSDFPVNAQKAPLLTGLSDTVNLKVQEIKMIREALKMCDYKQTSAAGMLGITRDALIRKMRKYDIAVIKREE